MSLMTELPERVVELLAGAINAEFATLSAAGTPIDTPMLVFPSEGMRSFDVCTGLAYPAKAERARNNPKVGLLFEGRRHEPVVSIAGLAAVRDSDIQANLLRYISETAYARPLNPPWSLARKAVYYWSRILVAVTPVRVLWWESREQMDRPPQIWTAPAGTDFPVSDPRPPGAVSASPKWPQPPWRELAEEAIKRGAPAHLTLCDDEGYPLPIRAKVLELAGDRFILHAPQGAPWRRSGPATLTFLGRETFVGEARADGGAVRLEVERALPINPFVNDPHELWEPSDGVYQAMMGRLQHELGRRGQPLPVVPEDEPVMTEFAKVRRARLGGASETSPRTE